MATKHWGEIEENKELFVPDVSADIERSMNKFCLVEYESECADVINQKTQQIILPPMDPLMLNAITLHKHENCITEMIRVAELALETNVTPPKDAVPPMPQLLEVKYQQKQNNFNFHSKHYRNFTKDTDLNIPELSEAVVKQILMKSVAIMLAQIGYETTHHSELDVLVDVLETFLKKICDRLKLAKEDEEKSDSNGFPHTIERVLTEVGLGGIKGLHDYYNTRVIKYISVLQQRCKDLSDHYENILETKNFPASDTLEKLPCPKIEAEVMDIDNPEVHLSSSDTELGLSSLETGFQLLNRLETKEF